MGGQTGKKPNDLTTFLKFLPAVFLGVMSIAIKPVAAILLVVLPLAVLAGLYLLGDRTGNTKLRDGTTLFL